MIRGRSRLLGAGVAAAGAGALAAAVAVRRTRSMAPALPDAGPLAAETAVSVHNAAKGTIIAAIRSAEEAGPVLVAATVHEIVNDAASAGADLTAAAIGAVEGTAEVAHLIDHTRDELIELAGRAAVDAASAEGDVAGARVRDLVIGSGR
ncbi:MAG: hypothetical protein U5R31_07175 [Acidimicrobiia bacterium]|nr:hypothetical protein [Acidimicrobiia bacterium]